MSAIFQNSIRRGTTRLVVLSMALTIGISLAHAQTTSLELSSSGPEEALATAIATGDLDGAARALQQALEGGAGGIEIEFERDGLEVEVETMSQFEAIRMEELPQPIIDALRRAIDEDASVEIEAKGGGRVTVEVEVADEIEAGSIGAAEADPDSASSRARSLASDAEMQVETPILIRIVTLRTKRLARSSMRTATATDGRARASSRACVSPARRQLLSDHETSRLDI